MLKPPTQQGGEAPLLTIGLADLNRGFHAAMAPNPSEGGLYNILSDLQEDPFLGRAFDPTKRLHAVYAPVFPPEVPTDLKEEIREIIDGIPFPPNSNEIKESLCYVSTNFS